VRRRPTRRDALAAGAALAATTLLGAAPARASLLVASAADGLHDPGPGQWDRPPRTAAVLAALARDEFRALARAEAPPVALDDLLRVHAPELVAQLEKAAPREGLTALSRDLVLSPGSLEAARCGAGGACLAVDRVMAGAAKNAFVAARPPGHHATRAQAMGFCLFNNAAIAVRRALAAHGAERVAIIDFDVHHGNGTQEIFWAEKNVLYCSTHQTPLYPGTGAASETGAFDTIVNAPLAKGDGGERFRAALTERVLPRLDAFASDFVIVSAGFDARLHDPLGGLRLLEEDFREATLRIMEIAARRCRGRIVSLLEGGYRPDDLAACVAAHVGALMEA
jgi:acetoin utilization deacetylase AcuC-like enzyme